MYLKRIEISGFKSFVDDTALEFSPGISSIIGPNGCGKSNILDALRWVLGEQNPRMLRAEKMADIIWNGSSTRKATSFAEASLIFTDAENVLSMNFHEITITRRLYRTGESEYLINKTPCRLKDIDNLFMDTGIGSHAYSVMEQGKIDQLLAMKPDQRRFIFEEAAGITKYQTRKEESIRKLQRTEENLLRLNDIITEVKRQVNSVERQARQAQRYQEYEKELRTLEVALSKKDYDRLSITWKEMSEKLTGLKDALEKKTATIATAEAEFETLRTRQTEIDTLLANLRQNKFDTDSLIEKTESQIELSRSQVTNADDTLKTLQEEIVVLETRISKLTLQQRTLEHQKEELNEKIEKQKQTIADQQAELATIISTLHQNENSIEAALKSIVEGNEKLAQLQGEMGAITASLEGLSTRRKEVGKNIDEKAQSAEQLKEKLESAKAKVSEFETAMKKTMEEIGKVNRSIQETSTEKTGLLTQLEKIKHDLTSSQTRRASLLALKESYEGYQSGTKSLLQGKKTNIGACSGITTTVAEIIRTEPKYELAIEVALGNALNYLVADTVAQAKSALSYLASLKSGMATVLPLELIRQNGNSAGNESVPSHEGILGRASDLVKYDNKYQPIIQALLGHILIVNDLDHGVQLLSDKDFHWELVTLSGERITGYGAISGGAVKTPGLLAQDREINELAGKIKELEGMLTQTMSQIGTFDSKLSALDQDRTKLQQQLHESDIRRAEAQRDVETLLSQQKHVADELDMLSTVQENNLSEEENQKQRQLKLQEDLKAIETKLSDNQKRIDDWRTQIGELGTKREIQNHAITQLQVDLATLQNQNQNIEAQITQTTQELQTQQESLGQKVEQKKIAETKKQDAEQIILDSQSKLKQLLDEKDMIAKNLTTTQEEKIAVEEKVTVLDKQLSEARRDHSQIQNETHELDITVNQHRWQIDNLHQRIFETYHIDIKEPVDVGEVDLNDETAVSTRIQELKTKIERLGPTNIGALQEFEEAKQRFEFLKKQEDDEKAAIDSLRSTINHINSTTKQLFIDAFNAAQANFHEVFRRLFRGGNAKLVMIDSENPLESGIDVIVQPPGKNLQSITLLSGGEKALSAIALLFSIYLLKPAPVCVLDEIDAPLDDVNIGRFTELVREMTAKSQFVIITHNKRTMEAADNLYGVTMEEAGVSKVVAVRLTGEALYDQNTISEMEFQKGVIPHTTEPSAPVTNN